MPDPKLTLIFAAKDLASKEAAKLKGALGGIHGAAMKAGGGIRRVTGMVAGLAKAALLGAAAIGVALVGALGAAIRAAADEQVGLVRLSQALKANVKGFDGNTAAIEKRIAAGEKLGFADDAQRAALARLLPMTHNVKKAQDLIATAMDLARAKGIDLATAVGIVAKANLGQVGALKKLGIIVPPVTTAMDKLKASHQKATPAQIKAAKAADLQATATKALGIIQKTSAGQAAKYGDTVTGMGDAIKITFGDIVEDIGVAFLPAMKGVLTTIRDQVIPAISAAIPGIIAFAKGFVDTARKIVDFVVPKVQAFVGALVNKGGVVDSVGAVVGPIVNMLIPKLGILAGKFFELVGKIGDFVGVLWGDGKGPLAIAVKAVGGLLGGLIDLAGPILDFIGKLFVGLGDIISRILDILGLVHRTPQEVGHIPKGGTGKGSKHVKGAAQGGLIPPGTFGFVGENRRESIVAGPGGAMVYGANSGMGGGGGGSPLIIQVMLPGIGKIAEAVSDRLYYEDSRASPSAGRK